MLLHNNVITDFFHPYNLNKSSAFDNVGKIYFDE